MGTTRDELSSKVTLLDSKDLFESDRGYQHAHRRPKRCDVANIIIGIICVLACAVSVVAAVYSCATLRDINAANAGIKETRKSIEETWVKISSMKGDKPIMQPLREGLDLDGDLADFESSRVFAKPIVEVKSVPNELGNSFEETDVFVESSGDYNSDDEDAYDDDADEYDYSGDDTSDADIDDDDYDGDDEDDDYDYDETDVFDSDDESEDSVVRQKRSSDGNDCDSVMMQKCSKAQKKKDCKKAQKKCRKNNPGKYKCKRGRCQKVEKEEKPQPIPVNLKSAHFSAISDDYETEDMYDDTKMIVPCKFIKELDGTLCANRTFTPRRKDAPLKIFEEVNWMKGPNPLARLEDNSVAIVNEDGIYLVYAQGMLGGNGATKGIAILHQPFGKTRVAVASCTNGVHPNNSNSESTQMQTCFVQRLLKVSAGDRIMINGDTDTVEASISTFFGLVKISNL